MRTAIVVDDDPDILQLVLITVQRSGFTGRPAKDGYEALRLLQEEDVQVVVMDVLMPGLSGIEVCRRIKASDRYSHLPVVLLTAGQTDAERRAGLESGADAFVTKPFSPMRLSTIIEGLTTEQAQEAHCA